MDGDYVKGLSKVEKWKAEWDEVTSKLKKYFVRSESTVKEKGGKSGRNGKG